MQEMLTVKGMHVGEDHLQGATDEDLLFCKRTGVEYVSINPPLRPNSREEGLEEGYWDADSLARWREHVESFGLKLAAMGMYFMGSVKGWSSIMLGTSQRDRDIEKVCQCIEAAGKAGIPLLMYDLTVLPVARDPGWAMGRGGGYTVHFDYERMKSAPLHPLPAGPISAEQAWERMEYFLKRVIPVAEEYKVKMACHPNDVPVPPGTTYRGVAPVLSNIDGLKRFVDLDPSPYHGLLFCQGCASEMTTSPEQVYETIRYFGSRKKIFWVHFRNIRGSFSKFEETFPDEGDIDMLKAMRIYKEVGYDGVLVPDHVPGSDLDTPWGHRAHAFCVGYIKALIQAVESENQ